MIDLILMRHGIATDRDAPEVTDDDARALTDKGRKQVKQIAAGLKRLGSVPDWVVTSPLVRAAETAELAAAELRPDTPASSLIDTCKALKPGGSPEELLVFLERQPSTTRVLLVGHEPDLGALAARMIGAGRSAGLAFKKGGCCLICFDGEPRMAQGTLIWWMTPKLLRAIG